MEDSSVLSDSYSYVDLYADVERRATSSKPAKPSRSSQLHQKKNAISRGRQMVQQQERGEKTNMNRCRSNSWDLQKRSKTKQQHKPVRPARRRKSLDNSLLIGDSSSIFRNDCISQEESVTTPLERSSKSELRRRSNGESGPKRGRAKGHERKSLKELTENNGSRSKARDSRAPSVSQVCHKRNQESSRDASTNAQPTTNVGKSRRLKPSGSDHYARSELQCSTLVRDQQPSDSARNHISKSTLVRAIATFGAAKKSQHLHSPSVLRTRNPSVLQKSHSERNISCRHVSRSPSQRNVYDTTDAANSTRRTACELEISARSQIQQKATPKALGSQSSHEFRAVSKARHLASSNVRSRHPSVLQRSCSEKNIRIRHISRSSSQRKGFNTTANNTRRMCEPKTPTRSQVQQKAEPKAVGQKSSHNPGNKICASSACPSLGTTNIRHRDSSKRQGCAQNRSGSLPEGSEKCAHSASSSARRAPARNLARTESSRSVRDRKLSKSTAS